VLDMSTVGSGMSLQIGFTTLQTQPLNDAIFIPPAVACGRVGCRARDATIYRRRAAAAQSNRPGTPL